MRSDLTQLFRISCRNWSKPSRVESYAFSPWKTWLNQTVVSRPLVGTRMRSDSSQPDCPVACEYFGRNTSTTRLNKTVRLSRVACCGVSATIVTGQQSTYDRVKVMKRKSHCTGERERERASESALADVMLRYTCCNHGLFVVSFIFIIIEHRRWVLHTQVYSIRNVTKRHLTRTNSSVSVNRPATPLALEWAPDVSTILCKINKSRIPNTLIHSWYISW